MAQREGKHLRGLVPLSLDEAVLGTEIEVPLLEGSVRIKVQCTLRPVGCFEFRDSVSPVSLRAICDWNFGYPPRRWTSSSGRPGRRDQRHTAKPPSRDGLVCQPLISPRHQPAGKGEGVPGVLQFQLPNNVSRSLKPT